MLKQSSSKKTPQQPLKLPTISTRPDSSGSQQGERRAVSSAKNTNRTDDLQKQLFSKLEEYDTHARKERRLEKLDGLKNKKANKQEKSATLKETTKEIRNDKPKRTSAGSLRKSTSITASATINDKDYPQIKTFSTILPSHQQPLTLAPGKQNQQAQPQAFITNSELQNNPSTQQILNYEPGDLTDCPYSEQQMAKLYREYEKDDCYIEYTSEKELKEMSRMLTHCQEEMGELEGEMRKLMTEVGYLKDYPDEEEEDEEEEQKEEQK